MHAQSLHCVRLFVALWSITCQAPLSMGFPRQVYWSGLPYPLSGDLPKLGIKPAFPSLAGRFFITNTPWEAQSRIIRIFSAMRIKSKFIFWLFQGNKSIIVPNSITILGKLVVFYKFKRLLILIILYFFKFFTFL